MGVINLESSRELLISSSRLPGPPKHRLSALNRRLQTLPEPLPPPV